MKDVLVMFSGGKDSLYSAILMLESGYRVNLVHYSTIASCYEKNVKLGYKRLVRKYGEDKVKYWHVDTSGFFRIFMNLFYNEYLSDIKDKYGDIKISELNCLLCRLSMYITSIIICIKHDIKYCVDGARRSQLFAIEQRDMLELFQELFKKYEIELLLPLEEFSDDNKLKNELLIRGFVPKVNESQCLIGMPIKEVDKLSIKTAKNIYQSILLDMTLKMIEEYKNVSLGENLL